MLNISREHLLIDRNKDGWLLVDRGRAWGTKINERQQIGGDDTGCRAPLLDGDIITIGTRDSPFRYRFIDLSGYELVMRR